MSDDKYLTKEEFEKMRQALLDVTNVQCSNGSWNYDEYMHGMANGLILAKSIFSDNNPEYLDKPEVWLKDKPDAGELTLQTECTAE